MSAQVLLLLIGALGIAVGMKIFRTGTTYDTPGLNSSFLRGFGVVVGLFGALYVAYALLVSSG